VMTIRWSRVKLKDGEKWTAYTFPFDQRLVLAFKAVPTKERMWWPGIKAWFVKDTVWSAFHEVLSVSAELHGWELMRDPLLGKRVVAEQLRPGGGRDAQRDEPDPFKSNAGPGTGAPPPGFEGSTGPRYWGFADFASSYRPPPPPRRGNAVRPEDWRALHLLTSAPPALVKAAHRALVLLHHPDRAAGDAAKKAAEEKVKDINVARDRILASLGVDA